MKKWLTGGRGTVVMVLTWTVGWALGFGGIAELVKPQGIIGDVWPTIFAIPGFIGGIVFSALLRIVEARRGFDEVSLTRFVALGVVTGVVLGGLGLAAGVGDANATSTAIMFGVLTGLSVVAAIGSALFFRVLAGRQTHTVQA